MRKAPMNEEHQERAWTPGVCGPGLLVCVGLDSWCVWTWTPGVCGSGLLVCVPLPGEQW